MIKLSRLLFILFLLLNPVSQSYASALQQIIGTQAMSSKYRFTSDDAVVEQAKRMIQMGTTMIKIQITSGIHFDTIVAMPFDTIFIWWRSESYAWADGMTEAEIQAEYIATYDYVKKLLMNYSKQEKTFFIGHWEGDWYLISDKELNSNPSKIRLQGMIDWLNIRQKAIDDARRDVGVNTLSKVYQYAEVNRVRDAMVKNLDRVVNKVLPYTNVDYVSYSAYDVQNESQTIINETIQYIENRITAKATVPGHRVFIGEFGIPAMSVNFNSVDHEMKNREIMMKFLKTSAIYILYWQMYNNEIKNNVHVGYWLIDNNNNYQKLYYTFADLYKAQKGFKDMRQETLTWLDARRV